MKTEILLTLETVELNHEDKNKLCKRLVGLISSVLLDSKIWGILSVKAEPSSSEAGDNTKNLCPCLASKTQSEVKIKLLNSAGEVPRYTTPKSAGCDLISTVSKWIRPREREFIPTGIAIELPPGYEGQIRPRSGLAGKHGITVLNTPGTLDEDYRGEVKVLLINLSSTPYFVSAGDRVAQLVVAPYTKADFCVVDDLTLSLRGKKGFGHIGR